MHAELISVRAELVRALAISAGCANRMLGLETLDECERLCVLPVGNTNGTRAGSVPSARRAYRSELWTR
jgi:hypothetical protein